MFNPVDIVDRIRGARHTLLVCEQIPAVTPPWRALDDSTAFDIIGGINHSDENVVLGMMLEPTSVCTDRLLLRPFQHADADDLFVIYGDEEVAYYALPGAVTREDVAKTLDRNLQIPWSDRPNFAVLLGGRVIGEIVLEINRSNFLASLGYAFAQEYWGKGLATEAARAVVDYGFQNSDLAKIYAQADPRNVGSVRVMEKIGMRWEGLFRSHVLRRGERRDRVYYGILREEWELTSSESR